MTRENEKAIIEKDQFNELRLTDAIQKFTRQIQASQKELAELKAEAEIQTPKRRLELSEFKNLVKIELKMVLDGFTEKLELEGKKIAELEEKNSEIREKLKLQMSDIESHFETKFIQVKEYYKQKIDLLNDQVKLIGQERKNREIAYNESINEISKCVDDEALEISYQYEKKLNEERELLVEIKQESALMRAKFEKLNKEIDLGRVEMNKLSIAEKRLQMIIKSLTKDVEVVEKEIQERKDTMADKDKRTYDLKVY